MNATTIGQRLAAIAAEADAVNKAKGRIHECPWCFGTEPATPCEKCGGTRRYKGPVAVSLHVRASGEAWAEVSVPLWPDSRAETDCLRRYGGGDTVEAAIAALEASDWHKAAR